MGVKNVGQQIEHLLTYKNGRTNDGVVSTPLPSKLLSPGLKPKEYTLRRSQTGQAWLELQSQ